MSVEIIEQFVTEIVSQLKYYNLLIIDSDVGGIVDELLNDENLSLKYRYDIEEKF